MSAARYDMQSEDEMLLFPLGLPKAPARNYFVFGKPIYTRHIDPKDRDACASAYAAAKSEVERGISDLLRNRDDDPYRNTVRRAAYERFWEAKAPSIKLGWEPAVPPSAPRGLVWKESGDPS